LGLVLGLLGLTGTVRAQVPAITAISGPRQVVTINQNLTLTVAAAGATGFQWRRNGLAVAGATNASYTITAAIPYRDNGWYQAVATNASGATTSAVVFVNVAVNPAWVFSLQYNLVTIPAPGGLSSVVAVAAGWGHSLALKSDGTVIGWVIDRGRNIDGEATIPAGLSGVVAVAAGQLHSLALKSDGTVIGWGSNYYGQATIPSGLSGVVAVAAGTYHSLALKSDGTVIGWGYNYSGQATIPNGLSGVVAVAADEWHSLALKSDGTVIGWGSNTSGATTIPSGLSGVVAVAAGSGHSLALKSDGTVIGWGSNTSGATTLPSGLSGLSGVVAVAAVHGQSMALKSDGTVVGWVVGSKGETKIRSDWSGVQAITGGDSNTLFLRHATGDLAPTIATQPSTRTARVGERNVTLSVTASGTPPFSYQWLKDGIAIPGATSSSYAQYNVPPSAAGVYSVTVANAAGAVTSSITTLAMSTSRFTNVSVRSAAGTGDSTLIVGFALLGDGSKRILLRGIGPGLTQFGVTGALADPQLRVFNSAGVQMVMNDDWGGGVSLSGVFAEVGAFPLTASLKDAALFLPLTSSWLGYTAQVTSDAGTGTALVEAYDADPAGLFTARFTNLSARTRVGTGDNILIVGFVIAGNLPMNVLIRAVGPGLEQFGVGGVLADPQLSVVKAGSSAALAVNDNWGGTPALAAAFTATGAFPLPLASKDAALLVTLQPGAYTAQVSGIGGTTGVALVEVYEAP
jgi:hypothetical protein